MTDRPRPRVIIATSMSGAGWTAGEAVPYLSAAGFRQAVAR